ncbi:hypothetical protein BH10CYA1_BH10CYA1_14360 [soil metagenome]
MDAETKTKTTTIHSSRQFLSALIADGRPLLSLTGVALVMAGGFAIFLSATGAFLPQDTEFLGMQVRDLCKIGECRTVHFMFHDRVSFGGVVIAIGTLYLWLTEFPLKEGCAWAWWTFLVSGIAGFLSFLAYLGYGYLDTWHGAATLMLLPVFTLGMWFSFSLLKGDRSPRSLLNELKKPSLKTKNDFGWLMIVFTGAGMIAAGLTIMTVGMTSVFVPEDLIYLKASAAQIAAINPHLIPLIAHDRAGFGGGLVCVGIMVALIALHAKPSPHLWQALIFAGTTGFICAIFIHFCIGYLVPVHLGPAVVGLIVFLTGMILIYPECHAA